MRINRLDLNQLVSLEALLTEQNVSRAADRVNLTQPAMSWTLARLREYFGDKLLVQTGRQMMLTPFAQSLVEPVRDVLVRAQTLTQLRPVIDPAQMEREIVLVASDYSAQIVLAEALRRAAQEAPKLQFHLRPVSEFIELELDRGGVDMVITAIEGAVSRHPHEQLFHETFSCVASADNQLVTEQLSRDQFFAAKHVVTTWGREKFQMHDQVSLEQGAERRSIDVFVPNFTMIAPFIVGTARIATVQTRLAKKMADQWPIKVVPCPVPIAPFTSVMQWHRLQEQDPAIIWLRKLLREVASASEPADI